MRSVLSVKGSPYEQGYTHGSELKEMIGRNLQCVSEKLKESRCDLQKYEDFIRQNLDMMKKNEPSLVEEMKGIADGAGLPFEEIVKLNIPAYFMTQYFNQECSMILARKNATADGCTYVVKNRDMKTWIEQCVLQRTYPDGRKMTEVTGAGTVTYPAGGINDSGLCVTTTGVWSEELPPDMKQAGSSQIFLNIHLVLDHCKNVEEAVSYVKQSNRLNGLNVLLADADSACVIEMTAKDAHVEYDDGSGLLFRTNHYCSESFSRFNPTMEVYPSTYKRSERIEELLKEQYGKIRFQDLLRIMSDHKYGINGICRHPQGDVCSRTVSCCLFVLEDRETWTALGNPCEQLPSVRI